MQALTLVVDGKTTLVSDVTEDLPRAVIISLLTWRRANPDDALPGNEKNGWWGDNFPVSANDRIGSRLWLLDRGKLTANAVARAREYAEEALQWLIEDGVAASVLVESERQGLDRLALGVKIIRGDQSLLTIRFANVWDFLNVI
jgi:phage gp46-like protein